MTDEKQRKRYIPITRCFLETDNNLTDYKAPTKIGLSVNIDGPCRNSVVRLTDRPDVTIAVYRGRKTTTTQQ